MEEKESSILTSREDDNVILGVDQLGFNIYNYY